MSQDSKNVIGMDLGDRYSQLCVLDSEGQIVERTRIRTSQAGVRRWFERHRSSVVVLEAGTHSRWTATLLEQLGHGVVVANPRRLQLISESQRKSDLTDAELLARLGRADEKLLSPITHRSERCHRVLSLVRARDGLVEARTKLVNQCRGIAKAAGYRLCGSSTSRFHLLQIPEDLSALLTPLMASIEQLTRNIEHYDKRMAEAAKELPETEVLQQVTGVGPVLALAFIATLEDPHRFAKNRCVGAYLGLCSRRDQSGQSDPQLPISKAGDPYLRRLLVNAAHCILRPQSRSDSELRRWGLAIAARGGKHAKKRAVVAVARKLSVLLLSLWKTGEVYQPFRHSLPPQQQGAV